MKNLIPITWSNQRVLTTKQIAEFYGVPVKNIQKNFREAKKQFVEGTHFFHLKGDVLRKFKADFLAGNNLSPGAELPLTSSVSHIYLWTVQGAARHAKMLHTQKAWDVFTVLENSYFNGQVKNFDAPETSTEPAQDIHVKIELDELKTEVEGLKLFFSDLLEEMQKQLSPDARAERLIAVSLLMPPCPERSALLLQAANLLIGKRLF